MPITKSAIKRMRSNKRKEAANIQIKSRLKTLFKKYTKLVTSKEVDAAKDAAQALCREYDKAASKNAIPKQRASRKKSRITRTLNKLVSA